MSDRTTDQTNARSSQSTLKRRGIRVFRLTCFVAILYSLTSCTNALCRISPLFFITTFLSDITKGTSTFKAPSVCSWIEVPLLLIPVTVFLCCFITRRFFCRFICPLGAILDFGVWIRRKVFKSRFLKNGYTLPSKNFLVFFSILWGLTFFSTLCPSLTTNFSVELTPLTFDPLAILSRVILYYPKLSVAALVFTCCFVVSPFFWRYRFCPCGVLQELLYQPYRLLKKFNKTDNATPQPVQGSVSTRRQFFITTSAIALASACVFAIKRISIELKGKFFRPPGGDNESQFLSRCARCGRCSKVCPTKIVQPIEYQDAIVQGVPEIQAHLLVGTPKLDFSNGYCAENCVACTEVCPTRALSPLRPEDKQAHPIALAVFDLEKCMLYYDRECSICRRQCPYEAIDLIWSDDVYANIPTINADRCTGCGRCVSFCPGEPIVNIFGEIEEESEEAADPREKALTLVVR